jgi:hypothetical protein
MKKLVMSLVRVAAVLALCTAATAPTASANHEICNPTCITIRCSSNADCAAAGYTRCDYACHQIGCCV